MSDNASTSTARPNGWDLALKYEFALRLLAMYREKPGSGGIEWSKVKMEGRTTKALTGVWTKMGKEIADMDLAGGAPMGSGAAPSSTSSAGGGESSAPKTPKKRAPKSQGGSAKKAKKEEPADDLAVKTEELEFQSDDADNAEEPSKEESVKDEI